MGKDLPNVSVRAGCPSVSGRYGFACGVAVTFAIWLAQLIAIPVGITYDGHVYINLADVLGTSDFAESWHPARTPLFPASLKIAFALFGRQPLALLAVTAGVGLLGVLLCGLWTRKLAGPFAGAAVMLVLAMFPTLVAYEHLVLTESGVFCALSLAIWLIVCRRPTTSASAWVRTLLLAAIFSGGYLWRQNLIALAPVFGFVHAAQARRYGKGAVVVQLAIVVAVPWLTKVGWATWGCQDVIGSVVLRHGIVKQGLIDPEDPLVRDPSAYAKAIEECSRSGNFNSGLDARRIDEVKANIQWPKESATALMLRLVATYPDRYLKACLRTGILLAGGPAEVMENVVYRAGLLSASPGGSMIHEGPPLIDRRARESFVQKGTDSWILRLMRALAPMYGFATLPAVLIAALVAAVALFRRRMDWAIGGVCVVAYLLPFALTLSSVDRYGFPVHPIAYAVTLAALIKTAGLLAQRATR